MRMTRLYFGSDPIKLKRRAFRERVACGRDMLRPCQAPFFAGHIHSAPLNRSRTQHPSTGAPTSLGARHI